ncbi:hypothetical protein GB937_008346 [Aspergillus fischeri]|nr:hypothetical protein GB937_008346 [Aspergillus fischeri]
MDETTVACIHTATETTATRRTPNVSRNTDTAASTGNPMASPEPDQLGTLGHRYHSENHFVRRSCLNVINILGMKCGTLAEREILCVRKPSEEQTETNVVLGVDNATGIEARYVECIAQQLSEIPRLELSVRSGRLEAGLQPTGHYQGGSHTRRSPAENVEDEQDNDEEENELIKPPVNVVKALPQLAAGLHDLIKPMVLAARCKNVTEDNTRQVEVLFSGT